MAAKIQRTLVCALLLLAIASVILFGSQGHWLRGAILAFALLATPAALLAAECCALWLVEAPSQRPGVRNLVRAWAHEVVAYMVTFGWHQPFRSTHIPDNVPSHPDGRRAVLLVHGLACNRGFWNGWMERLTAAGHPFLAIDLEPMFASIDVHSDAVASAVTRLRDATSMPPLIVAHSMGGLAVRRWLQTGDGDGEAVVHVITIGTPHAGTWMARFARSQSARQMRLDSEWLSRLMSVAPHPGFASKFTCIYGSCDNIVFPTRSARLEGARNIRLDATGHIGLAGRREVYAEALRWLRPPAGSAD